MQNQDAALAACLKKLSFCDEVVVVADRCTDGSQDIARRHGCVVVDGIFPLESQRKSAGVQACTGDWILEVEADELIDAHLAWEIRAVLQMRPDGDYYELPIDNYLGENLVRDGWTGALSASRETRLYRRGLKSWAPGRSRASTLIEGRYGGALKGAVRRLLGQDLGGLLTRLERLTRLAAEDLADSPRRPGPFAGIAVGVATMLSAYFGRGGWREGRIGLVTAALQGLFPLMAQVRAREVIETRTAAAAAESARIARLHDRRYGTH
ncbi:MAG: glycosyltransferase family 2 protein [Phenylobacterium sp.]|nr:glycosyltransferase family 2 protein [Phenylobacterium sp.]